MDVRGKHVLHLHFNSDSRQAIHRFRIFTKERVPGFGDLKISSHNTWPTLVFVLAGVILSTMSMDIVGRMYLKEIHYLGRKLQSNNPFYLLREAKAR